jgi:hypothetical protein
MKEGYAVTGYVLNATSKALKSNSTGTVEVAPEPETNDVFVTVNGSDIVEVRTGATRGKHTLVQLILKENAAVNTVVRSHANASGVSRFLDPTISRLAAAATAKVIMF